MFASKRVSVLGVHMYTCSSLGAGGCEVIGQVVLLRRWGVGSTVSLTLPKRVAKFCLLRIIFLGWMYTCTHAILLVLEDVRLLAKSCCFGVGSTVSLTLPRRVAKFCLLRISIL